MNRPHLSTYAVALRKIALCAAVVSTTMVGCADSGPNNGDGGNGSDGSVTGRCPQGVDPSVGISTAIDLAVDTDATGHVCPRTDKDYYKIVVPSGHKLLQIDLRLAAPTSPIQLGYLILKDAETVVGASPAGQNNQYKALHCIEPGTYYLQVQDDGNDAEDNKSAYTLRYSTRPDPDSGEPANNDSANALTTDTPRDGLISCTGDVDFYKVRVGANELFQLKLTTKQTTPVDLKYTVLRDVAGELEELMTGAFDSGSRDLTLLETLAAVPQANVDYFIRIEDLDGNDSDTDTPYTLEVSRRAEPDSNDISGGRNDHPGGDNGTATSLSLPSIGSACYQGTISGRIASQADVDYFKVDSPIGSNRGTIEIDLAFAGSTAVDPSFGLTYVSSKTCTKDKCCRVLDEPAGSFCTSVMSCTGSSFVCQEQGLGFCGDPACAGATPSGSCAGEKKCAGSVTCIKPAARCGATQFFRNGQDGGRVLAGHPIMHAGPWYIRVSDVGSDEYDYDATYTLRVKVCRDPDGALDNAYFARLVPRTGPCSGDDCGPIVMAEGVETSTIERFYGNGIKRTDKGALIPAPTQSSGNWSPGGWSAWIEGHIAYEHDTDHFQFDNPCGGLTGLPEDACMLQIQYAVEGDCPGGSGGQGLDFIFTVNTGAGSHSFEQTGTTAGVTKGFPTESDTCRMILRSGSSGDMTLDVSDRYHNSWSPTCKYRVRFRVGHVGCPTDELNSGPCAWMCDDPPCTGQYAPKCWVGSS